MKNPIKLLITAAILAAGNPIFATAEQSTGAYLAARQAQIHGDFAHAAEYYSRVLQTDPSNPFILESAVIAYIATAQFELALPLARRMEAEDFHSRAPRMLLMVNEMRTAEYDKLLARVENDMGLGPLADAMVAGWVHLGRGDMDSALAAFDSMIKTAGVRDFAIHQKALALASVGDFESADAVFAGTDGKPVQRTRRGVLAWAKILSQLDRHADAIALIDDSFNGVLDPEVQQLRDRLSKGDRLAFTYVRSAQDGMAEVFFLLGQAFDGETNDDATLIYSRLTEALKPDHIDAILMSASLLESLERYELAAKTYARVPRDHASFHVAELGRSEALRKSGKSDAAIEVLTQLAQSYPELAIVQVSTGDLHRDLSEFEQAATYYERALELYTADQQERWFVHYVLAICYERLDRWPEAESNFRAALAIQPEHPQVLNYLGYSLVEQQVSLDEALDMIERAVAAEPNSGYIVDSLGWVLYRLGRYSEAIGHMERAAELMPVDPVVNDHLGDVLWAVGRFTEAEFQWKRALSFYDGENETGDLDPNRIRRKLEAGLDAVLSEEGAAPLHQLAGEND